MIAHFDVSPTAVPAAHRERAVSAISESTAAERAGTGKLAARVARQIEQDVLRTGWPVGEVLGSETELRERYQVSRAVLREAIRLVEHHQVASMRRGPAGGLVVRAPDAGAATSAMVVYLEFVGTTIQHLFAARLMIEPLAAALAAETITESGIAELRTALADEFAAGPNRDGHARSALHLTIAELSGNPALNLFIDVLLRLTWRYAGDQLNHLPEDPRHPAFTSSDISHEAMVNSVVAGDGPTAQYLVTQHLEMLGEFLINWRPDTNYPPSALWSVPTPGHTQDQKLAEVVAQRLLAEITGGGWEVGSVIGSEAALLDRFGVSRAVLREAVRLLEYHSVARMRRGPGGGLVVAEPDPSASIEAMALYLDYQGIEVEHLRAVREAVELACLDRVAARVGEPEVARRLRAVLHGAETANPFGGGKPPAHLGELSHLLHVELAELAGNPVLALFLRILITLWARQREAKGTAPAEPQPEVNASVARAHQGIVDALLVGDGGLARHRMRRHLSLLTEWWQ
ncbi:MAG: GntR domain protein [Pseudonocardia sp.]|nr:GntR domain protein [Pseudonocardia sp.]